MNIFRWTHSREMQAANQQRDAAAEYAESLAVWQIEHGTDNHDFTPAQRERYRLWIRSLNAGLDAPTIAYWQHQARVPGWAP